MYAVVDGEEVHGVSTRWDVRMQDRRRMSPSPKIRCKVELCIRCKRRGVRWSAQINFILYTPSRIYMSKGSISFATLKALSNLSSLNTLKFIS